MTNKFQGIGRALHELSGEGSKTGEELILENLQKGIVLDGKTAHS